MYRQRRASRVDSEKGIGARHGVESRPFVVNASRHDYGTLWVMYRVLCGGQAPANSGLAGVWHMGGMD